MATALRLARGTGTSIRQVITNERPLVLGRQKPIFMSSSTASSRKPIPLVELREYELHPGDVNSYLKNTFAKADLRRSLTPLRLFTMPETGGTLNVATHIYHWAGGYEARNKGRAGMAASSEWKEYLKNVKGCMVRQRSTIFVEAPIVHKFEGVCGLKDGKLESILSKSGINDDESDCIYEMRRYKLKLGYDTVPNFLRLYSEGLPSKLEASGTDPSTSLITLLYTEVGLLNEVIEIWRHGGGTTAMERSRLAARGAPEWRKAIGDIAGLAMEFTTTIHRPLPFSPMR